MEEETKKTIIILLAITLSITSIFMNLALLIGTTKLEQKIIWTEKTACNNANAELIDNRQEQLLCKNYNKYPIEVNRLGKTRITQENQNPENIFIKEYNETFKPTAPSGQNHLPEP